MSRALYGFENYNQRVREPNGFCVCLIHPETRGPLPPLMERHIFIPHPLPNLNIPGISMS